MDDYLKLALLIGLAADAAADVGDDEVADIQSTLLDLKGRLAEVMADVEVSLAADE
jgi:hypothetical protein